MEDKKQDTTAKEPTEMVEVSVPRGSNKEENYVLVGVNGVNYQLPRGKKSKVPWYVAEEYNRAAAAEEKRCEEIDKLLESQNAQ